MEQSHIVSARKFRPQSFEEIVGQKHIVRTLCNALDKKRIAHAYLFSGTRGVGKTTTARILAKALNCSDGPTSTPCQKCDNCVEITKGSSLDVMEIDGASNTGVDNIRDLKENVMFTPAKSLYKIYIIDEVHQISKAAFNALLKTLEEPPDHVIFIFATTELNKVPDTILSRCQRFEYKSISLNDIITQLKMIAEKEGVAATPGAIDIIARRARGSMRDAQSMFDQAAAYGGGEVSDEDVKLILGLVDRSTLFGVMDAIKANDRGKLLEFMESIIFTGSDPRLFLEDMAGTIRNIMMASLRPSSLSGFEPEEKEKLIKWAGSFDYDELQRFFDVIIDTIERIKYSSQPELALEMGILRLTEKRGLRKIDDMISEVSQAQLSLERKGITRSQAEIVDRPQAQAGEPANSSAQTSPEAPEIDSNIEPAPAPIQQAVSGARTDDLLAVFKNLRSQFMGIFEHASVQLKNETVVIIVGDMHSRDELEDAENRQLLETAAENALGRKARVVVEYHDGEKKKSAKNGSEQAKQKERVIKKQVMETPIIQSAMDIFTGEVTGFKISKHL